MKLSTGKIAIPIEFDNGDVEYIYLNPNDREFSEKVAKFGENINERVRKINLDKYRDIFEDGVGITYNSVDDLENMSSEEIESAIKKTKAYNEIDAEYQKEVCAEIDNLFGEDVSEKIFKYVSPLQFVPKHDNPDENEPYIMQFIRALESELKKYGAKTNEAMKKHISKYKK